jgi:hypothetical protein
MQESTPAPDLSNHMRKLLFEVGPEDLSRDEILGIIALLESAKSRLRARYATNVIDLDSRRHPRLENVLV